MKLIYVALAGFILLIWLGIFDPHPRGVITSRRTILANTPFTLQTINNHLTLQSNSPLTIAIDPIGYVAIWQMRDGEREWLRHWQTWPHVRAVDNEIWVVWEDGLITVWINQEILWKDVPVRLECPCRVSQGVEVFMR